MERSYGVYKRRFPILHSGMQIRNISTVQKIVSVCAMLHNMCIDHGDVDVSDFEEITEETNNALPGIGAAAGPSATIVRPEIVQIFHSRLLSNNRNT